MAQRRLASRDEAGELAQRPSRAGPPPMARLRQPPEGGDYRAASGIGMVLGIWCATTGSGSSRGTLAAATGSACATTG